jgi:hypothetical protein
MLDRNGEDRQDGPEKKSAAKPRGKPRAGGDSTLAF